MVDSSKSLWEVCTECSSVFKNDKKHECQGKEKFRTKSSGKREEFPTGSRRDAQDGKGRFDLIPALPVRRLAELYERGAKVYGDRNWEKGQPLSRYLNSAERHLNDFKQGKRDEDHLISAVWNLFAYVWTENEINEGRLPETLKE